jgi:hypothetical protein
VDALSNVLAAIRLDGAGLYQSRVQGAAVRRDAYGLHTAASRLICCSGSARIANQIEDLA